MTRKLSDQEVRECLLDMPDDELRKISFTVPWQYSSADSGYTDPDKSSAANIDSTISKSRNKLQEECWDKLHVNPQVNTSVRGTAGRLTGLGFEVHHEVQRIEREIKKLEIDPRNRLYLYYKKYVVRALVEGELYICLTCHEKNGFIEVDFVDPSTIMGCGTEDDGIIFHPNKANFPLFYNIEMGENFDSSGYTNISNKVQIPSIFIARYPELVSVARENQYFNTKLQGQSKSRKKIYDSFGGYKRFIVAWDRSFITKRAVSYLRTTLEWLNHYENLKKYEIDHKRSSGAYLWAFKIEDPKAFKLWIGLTDAQRRTTGIMEKKTPGGSIVLPPGMDVVCINPNLSKITDQDTDILHMVTSGLNEPEDVSTGQAKGTYASVKASRGPMSDRISDEIAEWDSFLKYDFWGSIFFLKGHLSPKFPKIIEREEVIDFGKGGKEKTGTVEYLPEELLDISYPVSEMLDFESRAKGLLGVKHGPVAETVGVPNKEVAKRLGLGGYATLRRRKATEDKIYPELDYVVDAETTQENIQSKQSSKTAKKTASTNTQKKGGK